jgi:hypothetical protein
MKTRKKSEMAKAIIGPDENARIRYSVPTGRTIEFDVRANHSVKTYVMTKKGLEEWDNGNKKFKYFGGFQDPRRHHHQTLILPFGGHWYLVILNPSTKNTVEVTYEVLY